MTIVKLILNKLKRILDKKEIIVVAVVIIPMIIVASVMLSNRTETKSRIALISKEGTVYKSSYFDISVMAEKPAQSSLVLGNYDFVVEKLANGKYIADTVIKSIENKQIVENYFNKRILPGSYENDEKTRGVGTKTLGIMIMVIIMQAVSLTAFYTEDKTTKTLKRILTAPITENEYVFAQIIFTFVFLYIPTYIALVVAKVFLNLDIGFDYAMLAGLIAIITIFSTAFAIFISSLIEKNTSLVASSVSILTSIFAGCLLDFTSKITVINYVTWLLPQKSYMSILEGVEDKKNLLGFQYEFLNIALWTIIFLILGIYLTKRKMHQEN